jgi:hypothetical protein
MNFNYIFILLHIVLLESVGSVKIKPCNTCKYYIPSTCGGKYEIGDYFGKCRKFGYSDWRTKEINYVYAALSRSDENRCGVSGKYYEKNENFTSRHEYE